MSWLGDLWRDRIEAMPRQERRLYIIEPLAAIVRLAVQMLIGLTVIILICKFVLNHATFSEVFSDTSHFALSTASKALEVAAGVEFAYMLFTPGPDEALTPVILGIAAAILLVIQQLVPAGASARASVRPYDTPAADLHLAVIVLLLALSMAVLFLGRALLAWQDRLQRREENAEHRTGQLPVKAGPACLWCLDAIAALVAGVVGVLLGRGRTRV